MAEMHEVEPEFWLPAEFLTDEDILINNNNNNKQNRNFDRELQLTELTRHLTLHQKQTAQYGGYSNGGSPNAPSQVSSPTSHFPPVTSSLDLIYQAAAQISKLKINAAGEVPVEKEHNLVYQQDYLSALYIHFIQKVREEQILKYQKERENACSNNQLKNGLIFQHTQQNRMSSGNVGAYLENDETAWPSLQYVMQQNLQKRTGNNPVPVQTGGSVNGYFNSVRKPSGGTGVFLPRRYESNCVQTRTYKKTGSTSSFHGGMGEMNKAHLRGLGGPPPQWQSRHIGGHCSDYDMQLAQKNAMLILQRREQVALGNDLGLPQEWTY